MMTESNDYKWLMARERGEDVSHIPAHTRDKYRQIDQLIQDLPACAPSPGWKQRVLDSLDDPLVAERPRVFPGATARSRVAPPRRSAPPPPRRWQWAVGSGVTSLAAVFAVCAYIHAPGAPSGPPRQQVAVSPASAEPGALDPRGIAYMLARAEAPPTAPQDGTPAVEIRRAARRHRDRGTAPKIGDTLVIEMIAARPIELRVYGDSGEPLARCTETQGCLVEHMGSGRKYHVEVELRAPGAVRTVEYAGAAMPELFVSLDKDLEAAGQAGVDMRELSVVHVE